MPCLHSDEGASPLQPPGINSSVGYTRTRRKRSEDKGEDTKERAVGDDGMKEKEKQGERARRRRKIGPMVIDYLPRIPRIPYSDRPYGPKIEPSITGACSPCLFLFSSFLSSFFFFSSSSLLSSLALTLFRERFTRGRCSLFSRAAYNDAIPSFGNARAALIKRTLLWHLPRGTHLFGSLV